MNFNYYRRTFACVISFVLVLQLGFASGASALAMQSNPREGRPADSTAQPQRGVKSRQLGAEEFRREYFNYLTELEDAMNLFSEISIVRGRLAEAKLQPQALIADAKETLAQLNPEQISLLQAAYAKAPEWRNAPQVINSLIKPKLRQMLEQSVAARNGKNDSARLELIIADDCAAGQAANVSNSDIAVLKAAEILGESVMELLPTDGLTILARAIATGAFAVLRGLTLAGETLKAIKDDCDGDAFEAAIQQQITNSTNSIIANANTNTTTITTAISANTTTITNAVSASQTAVINNDNANRVLVINNDNANRVLVINNDNANTVTITNAITAAKNELRDLILRTQIEADLASTAEFDYVALYLTPNANGGYLDLVQTIVTQTLANIQAAGGGNISTAQVYLGQANAAKTAGKFKNAYNLYRLAYNIATK